MMRVGDIGSQSVDTLASRQNGQYFEDDISKLISVNDIAWLLFHVLLKNAPGHVYNL